MHVTGGAKRVGLERVGVGRRCWLVVHGTPERDDANASDGGSKNSQRNPLQEENDRSTRY